MENKPLTYSVGIFLTEKSDNKLRDYAKRYGKDYIDRKIGYVRNQTRQDVVKIRKGYPNEKLVIYCPQTDSYVDGSFLEYFYNLDSKMGQLLYEERLNMLGYDEKGLLVFQGGTRLNVDTGEIFRNQPAFNF